jgi:hypothetical protein
MSGLVSDLNLTKKNQLGLLASRLLLQILILERAAEMPLLRKLKKILVTISLSQNSNLLQCKPKNVNPLIIKTLFLHYPKERHPSIAALKPYFEAVFYNGNQNPSIPGNHKTMCVQSAQYDKCPSFLIAHAVSMKESYDNTHLPT